MNKYKQDLLRYSRNKMPKVQKYFRLTQETSFLFLKLAYKLLFCFYKSKNLIEISDKTEIGPGLYLGHCYCITINPNVKIGRNCNIHKGVTIGQENRGKRKGTPVIGNNVWIGVNSTIVGNISIGNDVLIAANTFVNCNIPDHSVVYGNPCIIKNVEDATQGYINNKIEENYK